MFLYNSNAKVFKIVENAVERVVRFRRRGKELVTEPYIADTNEHNELGRAQVERHTPFRGATSDMAQCGVRCNFDFQFMPRAPVLPVDLDDSTGMETEHVNRPNNKSLTYDRAEAFYGIRMQLPADAAMLLPCCAFNVGYVAGRAQHGLR